MKALLLLIIGALALNVSGCAYLERVQERINNVGKSTHIEVLEGGTKNDPETFGIIRDPRAERVSYRIGGVVRGVDPSTHHLVIDFTDPQTKEYSHRMQTNISRSGYFFVISPLVRIPRYGFHTYPVRVRLIANKTGKIVDEVDAPITIDPPYTADGQRQFGGIRKRLPKDYQNEFRQERAIKYFKFP